MKNKLKYRAYHYRRYRTPPPSRLEVTESVRAYLEAGGKITKIEIDNRGDREILNSYYPRAYVNMPARY